MIWIDQVLGKLNTENDVLRAALLGTARQEDLTEEQKQTFILARGLEAIHTRQGEAMILALKSRS